MSRTPGEILAAMRANPPLVQCLTNHVAMNIAANVMLAAGASPAMASDVEEAEEFAGIAAAVTVNIGTLGASFVAGAEAAIRGAKAAGRPWVLDPVACQATGYRRRIAAEFLAQGPSIIRGNASEVLSLAGEASRGRGVDGLDSVAAAEDGARRLAVASGSVVAVTGEVDYVTDGRREVRIEGGIGLDAPEHRARLFADLPLRCLCGGCRGSFRRGRWRAVAFRCCWPSGTCGGFRTGELCCGIS